VAEIDIIGEGESEKNSRKRTSLFKDIRWIYEIDNPHLLSILRNTIRKWLDGVENFAQYMARRMQSYGLVIELNTNMYPVPEGYTLNITFKLRGIREDVLRKRLKFLRRIGWDKTQGSKEFRRAFEKIEEGLEGE